MPSETEDKLLNLDFAPSAIYSAESERIRVEYERRSLEVDDRLYAPWNPTEQFMRAGRERVALRLLHNLGVFPGPGDRCLEIGYGKLGWLGTLISWGVRETDLSGIELDEIRAGVARAALPAADLRVGEATTLPWGNETFKLVVVSTVFTSILQTDVRQRIADEIKRVLAPGGALLWYDFRVNNPKNKQVRKVDRRELRQLFKGMPGKVEAVTLAPPLARLVAPRSHLLAMIAERIPVLRTHHLAVLLNRQPPEIVGPAKK
ncbi:MAG: class I SAM-dependent methyltransferase [Pyrinomonadaceae bacterium]